MLLLALVGTVVGAAGLIAGQPGQNVGQDDPVNQLFSDYWSWRLERSPEFATLVGSKDFNSILETFTEKRFEEDFDSSKVFIERANVLKNLTESSDILLNLDVFTAEVQTYVDGYHFNGFYFPVSYLEGVQVDFQRLAEWGSLDSKKDYEDLIARYSLLDPYMDQVIEMMSNAVDKNLTNNDASMSGVVEQCKAHLVEVEKTVFFEPFKNLSDFSADDQENLRAAAILAIKENVQPAFVKMITFLENEYLPATRPDIAVSKLPGIGEEFYEACLLFHTSTNLTATDINAVGLSEVERIEEEMRTIVIEMGYGNMSLQNFTEMIRNDPKNYYTSADELLEAFHEIIENQIDGHLLEIFHNKPAAKLEIVGMPPSSADGPAAFYTAGTPDGSRPGVLYVNTNKFDSQPKYEMISLSLHETNPGHHLQASYNLEQEDLPMFRKVMEDRIYSQVPSRFPINTGYIEGWALYSETLGFDMGLYDDPLYRFGHLSEEIFRACRLVVDTGMHALSWTQEEAVQYMLEHTAASEESLRNEITRYITWPGQATAYKIGQLKILEQRQKAEDQLGDLFDLKDFHEVVLKSAGPLYILEEQVDKFIKTTLATPSSASNFGFNLICTLVSVFIAASV